MKHVSIACLVVMSLACAGPAHSYDYQIILTSNQWYFNEWGEYRTRANTEHLTATLDYISDTLYGEGIKYDVQGSVFDSDGNGDSMQINIYCQMGKWKCFWTGSMIVRGNPILINGTTSGPMKKLTGKSFEIHQQQPVIGRGAVTIKRIN